MKKQICSLIYREWCIMKKSFLLGGAAVLCVMLIMIMFILSAKYGNLAKEIAGDQASLEFLGEAGGFMATFLIPYCSFALAVDAAVYKSDIKANWTRFSIALPVSTKAKALAHTLFIALRMAVAFVFSIIVVIAVRTAAGTSVSASLPADIGMISVVMLIVDIFTEFMQSLPKDEIMLKKQTTKSTIIIMLLGVAVGLYCSKVFTSSVKDYAAGEGSSNDIHYFPPELVEKYTSFRSAAAPFLLPAIIIMFAAIFFVVKTNLDKQKKM